MIRLIATDMDGTLLDAHSNLSERTCRAVQRAMDAGILFSMASGRMTESMMKYAEALKVNAPMILYNGALVYDHRDGRIIASNSLSQAVAQGVARTLEEMGLYFQVYPGQGFYCEKKCDDTFAYEHRIRVRGIELGQPASEWINGDIIKILAIAAPEVVDAAAKKLRATFPGINLMKSRDDFLEIVSLGVDKGIALAKLGAALGIAKEEIMAFGDGQNDQAMLEYAGCGVAMANGVAEAKAVAQVIAPPHTEDGVAQIIEQLLDGATFPS